MNNPLVSVVIACFNGAEFLEGCVGSVIDQNANCEIIVVDDGSADNSVARAHAVMNQVASKMVVLRQKNRGPAAARNAGLDLAHGKYLCFLDIDDRHAPGFLAEGIAVLEKDPALIAVSCGVELVDAHRPVEPWQRECIERSLPCNVILRTDVARELGGFPDHPAFRGRAAGEDAAFRTELGRHGKIATINKPLFRYRVHAGSHFDFFLDRALLQCNEIHFRWLTQEETNGSINAATREYRAAVLERSAVRTLETLRTSVAASFEYEYLARQFAAVTGYLHPSEGFTLYSLAKLWPAEGATVEIGSFHGRSTCWLAAGCRAGRRGKVVAVDHFQGSPEHQPNASHADPDLARHGSTLPSFRRNLEEQKLTDWVAVRVGLSSAISKEWQGPIRLLFIDGEHSSASVRQDLACWSSFVVPHGLVVFHDVGVFPGVTQFYAELCAAGGGWQELARFHSLGILRRSDLKAHTRPANETSRPHDMGRRVAEPVAAHFSPGHVTLSP